MSRLKRDINKLKSFTRKDWHSATVEIEDYTSKCLNIVLPNCELTDVQKKVLEQAKAYAESLGIEVKVYITQ